MKTLRCDNCNTKFNVHDDCSIVVCPGCRVEVEAREGTPPTDANNSLRGLVPLIALALLLVMPLTVNADSFDDEIVSLNRQIAILQARIDYLVSLKAAGVTAIGTPATAVMVTNQGTVTAPAACSTTTTVVGSDGSMTSVTVSAGRRQPVRTFLKRLFHGRGRGAGACGG